MDYGDESESQRTHNFSKISNLNFWLCGIEISNKKTLENVFKVDNLVCSNENESTLVYESWLKKMVLTFLRSGFFQDEICIACTPLFETDVSLVFWQFLFSLNFIIFVLM